MEKFTKEYDFVEPDFFKACGFRDTSFYLDIMENFLGYFIQQCNSGHILNIVRMLEEKTKINPDVMIRFMAASLVLSTITNFSRSEEIFATLNEQEKMELLKTVSQEVGMIKRK